MIDVSEWQGKIDWIKVKNAGYHAIIRCGYGSDYEHQDDKRFVENVAGCEENGIPYGIYLYSYAQNEGQSFSEAAHAKRLIEDNCGEFFQYPVYIDVEEPGKEFFYKDACEIFCSEMEKRGYRAGYYASESVYNSHLAASEVLKKYSKWIASWGVSSIGFECDIWQYTNVGKVPGIIPDCDLNYCFIYPVVGNGGIDVNIGDAAKTDVIDFLVYKTLANAYGTGEERKKQLGDLYTDVQEKINKLLGV